MQAKRGDAVLSASIHATADFDTELPIVHQMWKFLLKHVLKHGAQMGAVADGQIAGVGPRARGHVDARLEPQRIPPMVAQDAVDHRQVVFDDVRQKQVLTLGDTNGIGGEGGKGVEQGSRALRGFVSERHANADRMTSRLFLMEHVGLSPLLMTFRCGNRVHLGRVGWLVLMR